MLERAFVAALVLLLLAGAVWLTLRGRRLDAQDGLTARTTYVRQEPPEALAFYKAYAEFLPQTPDDLERFMGSVAGASQLARHAEAYPVDLASLQKAADAFALAAEGTYHFTLSVADPDDTQLDRFADAHLIDEGLRPFFAGGRLRTDLAADEQERYERAVEALRIPDEPLLYYAMGAFWGQWLVVHRNCEWRLYAPLRPLQSFPDMLTVSNTLCMHPFSQVTKKLTDPEGDQLAFKASTARSMKRLLGPYLLTASISDAGHASEDSLPLLFREALDFEKAEGPAAALPMFEQALAAGDSTARVYALAVPTAWQAQRWDLVEKWHLEALKLAPRHPALNHNLAVAYLQRPGGLDRAVPLLKLAIEEDPSYARARITLATCLMKLGDVQTAREHAQWVLANDPQLKDEASSLLQSMDRKTPPQR